MSDDTSGKHGEYGASMKPGERALTTWQPFSEPLRATLTRTVGIAVIAGAVLATAWGGLALWPIAAISTLWLSFGGHWLELFFLNWLRPRLPSRRGAHVAARLAVWFIGGTVLAVGMRLTVIALTGGRQPRWVAWWVTGLAFIAIEVVAHLALQLRGRPSFFNGRG